MKNLKIALCFLFATIVSSNVFSQDFEIKSTCYAIGIYDETADGYRMKPKYIDYITIVFTKDKISMNDVFNSSFEIQKITTSKTDNKTFNIYHCKDNKGLLCSIIVGEEEDDHTKMCLVYSNLAYFYYTKN